MSHCSALRANNPHFYRSIAYNEIRFLSRGLRYNEALLYLVACLARVPWAELNAGLHRTGWDHWS